MPRSPTQPATTDAQRGFTLLELMMTIAIAAILMVIAVPTFNHVMNKTRAAQASNELAAALHLARSQAVHTGRVACVDPASASSGAWNGGWSIRLDMDDDGACTGSADKLIRSHGKLDAQFHLTGPSEIAFTASGALKGGADTSLTVCRSGGQAQASKITIHGSGTLSSHRDDSVTGTTCS